MSNKTVLERLLVAIDEYDRKQTDSDAFAQRLVQSIQALEGAFYSVLLESRDWQYKIGTEGYFDEEEFELEFKAVIPSLKG
ncbi:MAG: hypothetical protein AB8B87_26375 [Granulosicoccus sp.]